MGTKGHRMGRHNPNGREQTPEPSLSEKISGAIRNAGQSIKETISPTPQPPQIDPSVEGERRIRERLTKTHAYKTNPRQTSTPLYTEEQGEQKMRQKLAGDEPVSESGTLRRTTASERRERKIIEREEKRKAWAASSNNANNKNKPGFGEEIKEKIKEFGKDIRSDADRVIHGSPKKSKPLSDEETDDVVEGDVKEKIRLYGSGDEWRRDEDGMLYQKDTRSGKWVSTGKKSRYGKPKVVDDTPEEDEEKTQERSSSRSSRGFGSDDGGGGKEPKGALSAPTGSVSSGVLSNERARGSGYDAKAEKERMDSFKGQGSSLHVGSGYISAGSYKGSGYDEEREKERIEKMDKAGSPLSAGLGYISAGTYKQKPQQETGKLDLKGSDVYSTGQFKMKYGNQKPKSVEPQEQIDAEMAKLTALQTRQAQLTQLQQIQEMQKSLQPTPPVTAIQSPANDPETLPSNAMEYLFGVKFGSPVTKPKQATLPKKQLSATAQLFGSQTRPQAQQKQSTGIATADFFGLKFGAPTPKKKEPEIIGEFGGKKIKRTSQIVDVKVYTPKTMYNPTNKLPETKGGFMGLFEKTNKEKTPNQQKKINATATEFLFSK